MIVVCGLPLKEATVILEYFFSKNNLVIFDRYAHDILIDPIRYRYNLNKNLTKFFLKFFPKPDLWIFMINKSEVIWKRKKEVKFNILKRQLKDYLRLKKKYKNSIICREKKDSFNFCTGDKSSSWGRS